MKSHEFPNGSVVFEPPEVLAAQQRGHFLGAVQIFRDFQEENWGPPVFWGGQKRFLDLETYGNIWNGCPQQKQEWRKFLLPSYYSMP